MIENSGQGPICESIHHAAIEVEKGSCADARLASHILEGNEPEIARKGHLNVDNGQHRHSSVVNVHDVFTLIDGCTMYDGRKLELTRVSDKYTCGRGERE
jgi:hypothetical protein